MGDLRQAKGDATVLDSSYRLLLRTPWQLCGLFVDELIKNKGKLASKSKNQKSRKQRPFCILLLNSYIYISI